MKQEVLCDICGSSEKRVLFDLDRGNEQVINVICQRCGLVYVASREDDAVVKDRYSGGQFSLEARGSKYPSPKKIEQSETMAWRRFRVLSNAADLQSLRPGRLLEIGCGVGSFLRLMQGAGWDVLGLEPDSAYAETGKRYYGVPIKAQFYEEAAWSEGFFDVVASFHVLEHVVSPRVFLSKIGKELKAGGMLYLEVPCIEHPYGGDLENFFWSTHLYTFSKNTLLGLLKQVGFRAIQIGYVGDFLWILAENTSSSPGHSPIYPFDNPETVWRRTHRLHKQFLFLSSRTGAFFKIGSRVAGFSRRIVQKFRHQPEDLFPAIGRKTRSWGTKIWQITTVKLWRMMPNRTCLAHVGLHSPSNAGDTMLFVAVRRLMNKVNGPYNWSLESLWSEVSNQTVYHLNKDVKGIIIGGGGILLRDTNPNQNSGWQWNCSIEHLRGIEVPIVVFAIGYNRFRGQQDFDPIFRSHIQELVRRSVFFGLRNHGSIRNLAEYLDSDLASKLAFQPCPTTLLRHLYPNYISGTAKDHSKQLALNVAFDRHGLRFSDREDEILTSIARAAKWANQHGWEIYLAIHVTSDTNVIPWLIREKVAFHETQLGGRPFKDILSFYRKMPLTIGMRGHSQMIPFGLGNAIISVISHDKLSYFLEDISHLEWGVEVGDARLEEALIAKIQAVETNWDTIKTQTVEAQDMLWNVTLRNLKTIKDALDV